MYSTNLLVLFVFLALVVLISVVVFVISSILMFQTLFYEKNSIYECGFVPFNDARAKFEVKFYLVSVLFIVFDLELAYLFPLISSFPLLGTTGLFFFLIFLTVLIVGFLFEWDAGAIDW